jgi:hypothetical protein
VLLSVDGWEDVKMGDKKPKEYIFTKNAGPRFNLLPDAEPMDYFILFFNDELLNNTVIEANRYMRHKITELQLSLRSVWSRWSDVSVPEVKAFLGLIINKGPIPLPDIKDYWSSERKTQTQLTHISMCITEFIGRTM